MAREGRKVGSLKRRVRSHLARREMKNCTLLWRETHFQVKMYKAHHVRTTFGSCDVKKVLLWREAHFEVKMDKAQNFQVKMYKTHHARTTFGSSDVKKVHAVVARSTFRSENIQNTPFSDYFWKLRCRKSARREAHFEVKMYKAQNFQVKMYKAHHVRTTFGSCDVKKVNAVVARSTFRSENGQSTKFSSQNVQSTSKHTMPGPLLEVAMSKKCTLLWREAHFEVKMYKAHHSRTTFGS